MYVFGVTGGHHFITGDLYKGRIIDETILCILKKLIGLLELNSWGIKPLL